MPLEEARSFAIQAHGDQRYGDRPYVFHLDQVAALAVPYGEEAVAIAYLHDTVEDTDVSIEEIEARFGAAVAVCVALLTDQPGADRKERKARTYAKLAVVQGGPEQRALIVKAADRLANVRACVHDRNRRLWTVYQGEQSAFRSAAFRPGLCDPLWAELDALLAEGAFDVAT